MELSLPSIDLRSLAGYDSMSAADKNGLVSLLYIQLGTLAAAADTHRELYATDERIAHLRKVVELLSLNPGQQGGDCTSAYAGRLCESLCTFASAIRSSPCLYQKRERLQVLYDAVEALAKLSGYYTLV